MRRMMTGFLLVLLAFSGIVPAAALEVKGTAPTYTGTGADQINPALQKALDQATSLINKELSGIDTNPEKFIQAWGNSSVFSSQGPTQRGVAGYKLVAVTLGPSFGFQLPSSPLDLVDDLENIQDKLNKEHDLPMGFNPQVLSGQIGFNTGVLKFLPIPKGIYLGLRFGYMNLDSLVAGFSFNTMSLGLVGNYQFIPQVNLAAGLVLWRGINIGTGLIFQGTHIGYEQAIPGSGFDSTEFTVSGQKGNLKLDPKMTMDLDISTVTIPLEAVTSVRLLWFMNLTFGLGVDIGFGQSKLDVGISSPIKIEMPSGYTGLQETKAGSLSLNGGGEMAPNFFNPKIMTGLGFSLGPVILDIPVSFYLDNGYSVGITLGVAL